jgi:hypothetical protein
MKPVWLVAIVLLLIGSLLVARVLHSRKVAANAQYSNGQQPDPKVYFGLRNLMLEGTRAKFGISPGTRPTEAYGVLMDWGIPAGSATVVAIADGTASVYLSSGGGFLGGGQSHESIRTAAKRAVQVSDEVQALMHSTTTYPVAQPGQVNFYVLTDAGVFTASASEDDLRGHSGPFYKLGDSMQDIVTEYRRIQN